MRSVRCMPGFVLATLAAALATRQASAQCGGGTDPHCTVAVMAVDNYPCAGSGSLLNSDSSAIGFVNQLFTSNPAGFQLNLQDTCAPNSNCSPVTDQLVNDVDFLDPNTPNPIPTSDDSAKWDQLNQSIAFFQGHGDCFPTQKPIPDQLCISQAQCMTPGVEGLGATGFGACLRSPSSEQQYGVGIGVCTYNFPSDIIVCGSNDQNGGTARVSGGNVVLGENPVNGGWAGAGTNGGTAMAFVKNSCSMMAGYWNKWEPAFGGIHLYAGTMVAWGDSEDSSQYGSAVIAGYTANPNSSVQGNYTNAVNFINEGTACAGGYGGGFNGCGCNLIQTWGTEDANMDLYNNTFNESWYGLKTDMPTQTSRATMYWTAGCNYNLQNYPALGGD